MVKWWIYRSGWGRRGKCSRLSALCSCLRLVPALEARRSLVCRSVVMCPLPGRHCLSVVEDSCRVLCSWSLPCRPLAGAFQSGEAVANAPIGAGISRTHCHTTLHIHRPSARKLVAENTLWCCLGSVLPPSCPLSLKCSAFDEMEDVVLEIDSHLMSNSLVVYCGKDGRRLLVICTSCADCILESIARWSILARALPNDLDASRFAAKDFTMAQPPRLAHPQHN